MIVHFARIRHHADILHKTAAIFGSTGGPHRLPARGCVMAPEYCVIFLGDIPERGRWLLREARTALISAICAQVADIMARRYAPETSAISRSVDLLRVGLSYSHATRVAGGELIVAVIGSCIHFAFYADAPGEGDHDPTSPTTSPRRRPLPKAEFIRLLSRALRGIEWRGSLTTWPSAGNDRLYDRKANHRHNALEAYARGAGGERYRAPSISAQVGILSVGMALPYVRKGGRRHPAPDG
jgi:hypothetical protein